MTGRRGAVVAVDVGTTELKVGLVGLDGELLGLGRRHYPIDVDPATGRAEQDPEAWWSALASAMREVAPVEVAEVEAIGLTGQGPTLVALDAEGRATRPAITWLDTRTGAELAELSAATTLRGWSLNVLPAALWVTRHDRAAAGRTRWWLNSWEALGFRLTGRPAITLVPGQPFPPGAVLEAAGLDGGRVAASVAAGSVLGGLSVEAGATLGLPAGTPIVAGMNDAFASCHGAGMVDPGDAFDAGGAAGGFGVYTASPFEVAGSFNTPGPIAGRYLVGGAMAATGKALDWFRTDVLGSDAPIEALIAEAAAVPAGAEGLVFLPYLAGERSPLWDPTARGVFAGLTLRHGRGHLVRAILEAAALAIRHVAEPIVAAGIEISAMRVTGGPAQSETWNRIKADATRFPVDVPLVFETAVLGAAVAAAAGVGAHPDVATAIRAMTRIERRIEPDPATTATYDRLYEAYLAMHPAVAPILRRLVS